MARVGKPKVAPTFSGNYLGKADPPPGWLRLNEGKELTCNKSGYYLDPGHKRKGAHLVVMGGELYEVARAKPPTGQAQTVAESA